MPLRMDDAVVVQTKGNGAAETTQSTQGKNSAFCCTLPVCRLGRKITPRLILLREQA